MKTFLILLSLLTLPAQAIQYGPIDSVMVTPHTGGIGKWSQIDLSKSAAVKNQLGSAFGGLGINTSASTGVPSVSGGIWSVAPQLATSLGGLGGNFGSVAVGALPYFSATGVVSTLAGNTTTTAQVVTSTGTGSVGQAPTLQSLPGNSSLVKKVTIQTFLATGTASGYLFNISTSSTLAVGDTYTNNSNTYTVLQALSAQTGNVLFMSGASAPLASGTLARATGSGTSSITFTSEVPLATYTPPSNPSPLYLVVELVGGGGGGGGSGVTTSGGTGGFGGYSTWGPGTVVCTGGLGGITYNIGTAGNGGTCTITSPASQISYTSGAFGTEGGGASNSAGGTGGASPFAGAGGGSGVIAGYAAAANSGSGGGGAGFSGTSTSNGQGGGAGGYMKFLISTPIATFYSIGAAGSAGTAGTSGHAGGLAGGGKIIVWEYYQ